MGPFLLSQILAAGAFAVGIGSFQFKAKHSVFLCLFSFCILNGSHFLLLNRPGPAALLFAIGVRYITAIFTTDRRVMYLFITLNIGVFLAAYENGLGVLALIASILGSIASFQSTDRMVRLVMMAVTMLWIIHNTLARTPVAALMEAAFLGSNAISYWRFYLRRND